jgi:hypothetical protein
VQQSSITASEQVSGVKETRCQVSCAARCNVPVLLCPGPSALRSVAQSTGALHRPCGMYREGPGVGCYCIAVAIVSPVAVVQNTAGHGLQAMQALLDSIPADT